MSRVAFSGTTSWSSGTRIAIGIFCGGPTYLVYRSAFLWVSLPDLCLFTDTSDTGWGASLGDDHLSGSWSPLSSRFSINLQELLAVLLALRGFLPSLRGRVVAVFFDNTTTLAYLKKQEALAPPLSTPWLSRSSGFARIFTSLFFLSSSPAR